MYFSSIYSTERNFWSWNESRLLCLTPVKTAKVTKTIYKKAMLVRLWRMGNPHSLFTRMQTNMTILESSIETSQKQNKNQKQANST